MYNDFIIIGPKGDPAKINSSHSAIEAFNKIYKSTAIFASRGDESGTHKAELKLWEKANLDPGKFKGRWYRELGLGMGATLNVAVQMDAYVLSDRATWLAFKNKRIANNNLHLVGYLTLQNRGIFHHLLLTIMR